MPNSKRRSPECPLCKSELENCTERPGGYDGNEYYCPNCGKFRIVESALPQIGRLDDKSLAILSAATWQRQQGRPKIPEIDTTHVSAAEKERLPDPAEQLDRLVLFLGTYQQSPGAHIEIAHGNLRAKLGGASHHDVQFIVKSAVSAQLIDDRPSQNKGPGTRLTMDGWRRFHEIQRGAIASRTAFMAMPFRNPAVARIVDEVFCPAVEETGFQLKRLDDEPAAGQIDDRLRVEIRLCRFLIADLTGANSGAYWEAGYAEGLGKPVIYTCKETYFKKKGTHFDTNHHQTIPWDPNDPKKAADLLKATIRATLPFEAKMPTE